MKCVCMYMFDVEGTIYNDYCMPMFDFTISILITMKFVQKHLLSPTV